MTAYTYSTKFIKVVKNWMNILQFIYLLFNYKSTYLGKYSRILGWLVFVVLKSKRNGETKRQKVKK